MLSFPQYTKMPGPQKILYSDWYKQITAEQMTYQGVNFLSQKNPEKTKALRKRAKKEAIQFWSDIPA